MRAFFRKHAATVAVAAVTSFVFGGVPAMAHFTSITGHDVNHLDKDYTKTIYKRDDPVSIIDSSTAFSSVACPGGYVAMGGGAFTSNVNMFMEASYPTDGTSTDAGHTGWGAYVRNESGATRTFRAYVVCRRAFVNPGGYPEGSPPVGGTVR